MNSVDDPSPQTSRLWYHMPLLCPPIPGVWCFLLLSKPSLGSEQPGMYLAKVWPCAGKRWCFFWWQHSGKQQSSPHFLPYNLICHSKWYNREHLTTYKEDPNNHLSSACPVPCSPGISWLCPSTADELADAAAGSSGPPASAQVLAAALLGQPTSNNILSDL